MADFKGVFGFIGIGGPAFGDPRLHLQRFRVLPGELVGDLIQNAAIRVEAARWGIEIGVRLLFQIDKRAAFNRSVGGVSSRRREDERRQQRQAKGVCMVNSFVIFVLASDSSSGAVENKGTKELR